jgi:hypothetical protein
MRSRQISFLGLNLLGLLLLMGGHGRAQNSQPTEYQIKAAFIFNFAKFIEWPPQAFTMATSPIVIGVLGEDPFHEDLQKTIRGKTVDDHPLVVKALGSQTEATNCHILFISTSEKPRLAQILESVKTFSVLTVGEMDHFTESGGMIRFVQEGTKVRFQINNETATAAGLKISSKLLNLAVRPGG